MRKLLYIFCIFIILSCVATKTIEVPVETVKTEYKTNTKIDSVYIHDSMNIQIRNETVLIYKFRTDYKHLYKIDTVVRQDTVPKIIYSTREIKVEKPFKWYHKLLMGVGILCIISSIMYITYKLKK